MQFDKREIYFKYWKLARKIINFSLGVKNSLKNRKFTPKNKYLPQVEETHLING